MAKLMSKKTRETVQTSVVLAVVILFLVFYIIYPLVKISDVTGRADSERFEDAEEEIVYTNDISFFEEKGLLPDTFTVTSTDNIILASICFKPDSTIFDTARGTVILLHADNADRTSLGPYISPLLESGFNTVVYDQRTSGQSGGIYRYAGKYEAEDLAETIIKLNFMGNLVHPLIAVGFETGADAAIFAAQAEERIDCVIAVKPSLTSSRWIDNACDKGDMLCIPLSIIVYHWWYEKVTSYPYDRTGVDDILAPDTKTVILADEKFLADEEITRLREITEPEKLQTIAITDNPELIQAAVLKSILEAASINANIALESHPEIE